METLVLKLVVTPVLIAAATLVGRRWGQAVGGGLVGLPPTPGGLTPAASLLGRRVRGLLATFPLLAAVLAVFAHHTQDRIAAVSVLRGLLLGLFSFAAFFAALEPVLPRFGIGAGFSAAICAALLTQTTTLLLMGKRLRTT